MSVSYELSPAQDLVEIVFELRESQSFDGACTESLWARPIGQDQFQILNTPFHATGVSLEDIVTATPLPGDQGRFLFNRVVGKSGRSTYRILTYPDTTLADFLNGWKKLEAVGCTYEQPPGGVTSLYAIDVPPEADIAHVLVTLRDAQVAGVWDFEQGDWGRAG